MTCWTVRRDSYICLCEMSRLNVYARKRMRPILMIMLAAFLCAGCSGNSDNSHTTTTTVVPPPPQQVLRAEFRKTTSVTFDGSVVRLEGHGFDRQKPILFFNMKNGGTFREGQPVVIQFMLINAQLKDDGGEFR